MQKLLKIIIGFSVFISFISFGSFAQEVRAETPISIPEGVTTDAVGFSRAVIKIPRGDTIGKLKGGILCVTHDVWRMEAGSFDADEEIFKKSFRNELLNNDYNVVGDPDALFGDAALSSAKYMVSALIKDIKGNICFPYDDLGGARKAKGNVYLEVEWQVYSTLDRSVIYKVITRGSYKMKKSKADGFAILFEEAFSSATNNLLANKGFYNLFFPEEDMLPSTTFPLLKITTKGTDQSKFGIKEEFVQSIVEAQKSVVTLRSPLGHGSGFFVSSDGYIVTNQHVVGDADTVRVMMVNGMEIDGEVIRVEKRRDVALVKIPIKGTKPFKFIEEPLNLGETVYSIGSPLQEGLEGTVAKGVVSSYRAFENKPFIQSDVMVHPGNSGGPLLNEKFEVSGVSVLCRISVDICSGVNFFIPIEGVLDSLALVRD